MIQLLLSAMYLIAEIKLQLTAAECVVMDYVAVDRDALEGHRWVVGGRIKPHQAE
jgi:hypothetical protein